MVLNLKVIESLCKQYCYLYSQIYEKGFNEQVEQNFNKCKSDIGLVKELIGAEVETNMGKDRVGVRMVNPKNGHVLGECTVPINYKLNPVLSELFKGNYKKIADSLYSISERLDCPLEEVVLSCSSDYNVSAKSTRGIVYDVTKAPSIKELFRVIGVDKHPLLTIKSNGNEDSIVLSPVRIYIK